jgi:RNA polymerase sigma-70 factor (ECF subfamily)
MDPKQFTYFLEQYQRPLLSVVFKMVQSWETARDIVQDSFLKIWERYTVNDDDKIFYLLYRIAMNLAIDHLRKRKNELFEIENDATYGSELPKDSTEVFEIILKCSSQLKPKQKAAFVLRDIEGFDFMEMSQVLEAPVENIRSNLNLARKNIKDKLAKHYQITEEFFYEL